MDSEGENVPHSLQDSIPPVMHNYTYVKGDEDGYYDQGVWDRLSLSAALAHADENQSVRLRFVVKAVHTPLKVPAPPLISRQAKRATFADFEKKI